MHKQRGFTLVEVLIVVAISAIIGAGVVEAIYQTIATFNRNTACTEANSQVSFATRYIHQDAQMSQIVYRYNGTSWAAVNYADDGLTTYNLLNCPFVLERPFWEPDPEHSDAIYECFKYEVNSTTGELIRSHYYYSSTNITYVINNSTPDSTLAVARYINIDLTDSEGNPVDNNYWRVDASTDSPNGTSFTAQITCTVGDRYPQTISGKISVIRMMAW